MIENRNKLSVWLRISRSKYLYLLFILPFFYFVVFKYGAMMWLLIAFKKFKATRGLWGSTWVGLKYFEQFIKDPYFWKLVRNTVVLNLLGLVFSFPAPIVLALMINEVRSRRFKKVVQTVSYMPYFISTVAVCGLITTLAMQRGDCHTLWSQTESQIPTSSSRSAVPAKYATSVRPLFVRNTVDAWHSGKNVSCSNNRCTLLCGSIWYRSLLVMAAKSFSSPIWLSVSGGFPFRVTDVVARPERISRYLAFAG